MKKYLVIIMILLLLLAGCSASGQDEKVLEGQSPQAIIEKLYEIKNPGLAVGELEVNMDDVDNIKYFTGLDSSENIDQIAVSETMIGAQAYSLVLVRTTSSSKSDELAKEMREGIDPRKWICVGADDIKVVAKGDLVMLFMVSSELSDLVTSSEMVAAFKEVAGPVDLELN